MGFGVDGGSKYDSLILVYDESLGSKRAYFLEEDTDAWGGEAGFFNTRMRSQGQENCLVG